MELPPASPLASMAPRLLTADEITMILDRVVPKPGTPRSGDQAYILPNPDRAVALAIYENTRRLLTLQLKRERITPLAFDDLVKDLSKRLTQAQIPPGDNVGAKGGEALGAPVTQMTLNTFHQAGAGKDAGGGIDGLKALFHMQDVKYPNCTMHFKNKTLSEADIVAMRKDYVALSLEALLVDYDIALAEVTKADGTTVAAGAAHPPGGNNNNSDDDDENEEEGDDGPKLYLPQEYGDDVWWMSVVQAAQPELLEDVSPWYLRVELNVPLMVEFSITPELIAATMGNTLLRVVPGPMHTGVLYFFVHSDSVPLNFKADKRASHQDIVILYLQSVVVPSFYEIKFRGLNGVTRMVPAVTKITTVVTEEVPVSDVAIADLDAPDQNAANAAHLWRVLLHAGRIKTTGITAVQVAAFFRACGFATEVNDPLTLTVQVPAGYEHKPPSVLANDLAKKESIDTQKLRTRALQEAKDANLAVPTQIPDGPMAKASQYVYATAYGSMLLRALVHPDVDPYYTYSNEVKVVFNLFGIEAARNLWLLLLTQGMEQAGDTSTDVRHLLMMADILFNQGRPAGISFSGISRQKGSTLAMLTIERAMDVLSSVATVGGRDNTNAVSAAIMVGRTGDWGTGYAVDLLPDPEAEKRNLDALRAGRAVLPQAALEAAIDAMDEDVAGPIAELTEDDLFAGPTPAAGAAGTALQLPEPWPTTTLATEPLPPTVHQLLQPGQTVAPGLLEASQHLAVLPTLPQGAEALVVVTKRQRRVLPRFIPPQIALVESDSGGATSVLWDIGQPVPDFVPLVLPTTSRTVVPAPIVGGIPLPPPVSLVAPNGLPTPINVGALAAYLQGQPRGVKRGNEDLPGEM